MAALLMLGGIALLGIVTAGLASWLLDRIREVEEQSEAVTRADLARLAAQIDTLTRQVERLASAGDVALAVPPPPPTPPHPVPGGTAASGEPRS